MNEKIMQMRDFFPELWEKITLSLYHVFQIPGPLGFALLVEKYVYQSSLTGDSYSTGIVYRLLVISKRIYPLKQCPLNFTIAIM